jgi:hypothetical protein
MPVEISSCILMHLTSTPTTAENLAAPEKEGYDLHCTLQWIQIGLSIWELRMGGNWEIHHASEDYSGHPRIVPELQV